MTGEKYLQMFGDGDADQRDLLGGKGANLAEMTLIGLPVPPGFTITTAACREYVRTGTVPPELPEQVRLAVNGLQELTGKQFGGGEQPLLLSVRSGAAVSMPGMMDTVLNLGLNDWTVELLAEATRNRRFALDCYRRFVTMFGNVVLQVPHSRFEQLLDRARAREGVRSDAELTADALTSLIGEMRRLIEQATGGSFPQDPYEQLDLAIAAVFRSWNNDRAKVYREIHRIPDDIGTAVNVQSMVYGNMGADSGTGVVFTRDPATGERRLYGEYLCNAQGEDVVAGIRTPRLISDMASQLPGPFEELEGFCRLLEEHYGDVQDIEFTVERGQLYILQTRSAKRTGMASIRIARDMVTEGVIDRDTGLLRIDPDHVVSMLHRNIDPGADVQVIARGLPASPGAACGVVVFDSDEAVDRAETEPVVLVRPETTPDDIAGIVAAEGVLTSRGGMTCHAAIVARGMGKPCVVGCDALAIDLSARQMRIGDLTVREGDVISVDGATGRVIRGEVPMIDPRLSDELLEVLAWADEARELGVRANADTPGDAERAREFGAAGIGLCRTEHMFMGSERLPVVQRMILAQSVEERRPALDQLLPMQQSDFEAILRSMAGYPVTIRLLDPPLHEFLPNIEELAVSIARSEVRLEFGQEVDRDRLAEERRLLQQARALSEFNPMLGLRGCRLGLVYPEVYEMQARAIFQATATLRASDVDARPEVMIPLVGHPEELNVLRQLVERVADQVSAETGVDVRCPVGTMIEVPRACLQADSIARHAEFFSFGTNDLTQTVFGYSRDDAEGKFLHHYLERRLLAENPFAVLDREGVGRIMRLAVDEGRTAVPGLKVGICGEHGGDPRSIEFCHELGLDYVSCSPFRVPIARLAAARAAIAARGGTDAHRGE